MDFQELDKIWIHFGGEELSEVDKVHAVNFLEGLELEHVGSVL